MPLRVRSAAPGRDGAPARLGVDVPLVRQRRAPAAARSRPGGELAVSGWRWACECECDCLTLVEWGGQGQHTEGLDVFCLPCWEGQHTYNDQDEE